MSASHNNYRFIIDDSFTPDRDAFDEVYQKMHEIAQQRKSSSEKIIFEIFDTRRLPDEQSSLASLHSIFSRNPKLKPRNIHLRFIGRHPQKEGLYKPHPFNDDDPIQSLPTGQGGAIDKDPNASLVHLKSLTEVFKRKIESANSIADKFQKERVISAAYRSLFKNFLNYRENRDNAVQTQSMSSPALTTVLPTGDGASVDDSFHLLRRPLLSKSDSASDTKRSEPSPSVTHNDNAAIASTSTGLGESVPSRRANPTKKKRIAIDIDGDDCIFNESYQNLLPTFIDPHRTLYANATLVEFIQSLNSENKNKSTIPLTLLCGSNRQSPQTDYANSVKRKTSSIYYALSQIAEEVADQTQQSILLDQYTLEDTFDEKGVHGNSFERTKHIKREDLISYSDSLNPILQSQLDSTVKASQIAQLNEQNAFAKATKSIRESKENTPFDQDKLFQVYAKMHRLAAQTPDEEIDYYFVDDDKNNTIFLKLREFFDKFPEMRPRNVNLHLAKYAGPNNKPQIIWKSTQEGGEIDRDYETSIKRLKTSSEQWLKEAVTLCGERNYQNYQKYDAKDNFQKTGVFQPLHWLSFHTSHEQRELINAFTLDRQARNTRLNTLQTSTSLLPGQQPIHPLKMQQPDTIARRQATGIGGFLGCVIGTLVCAALTFFFPPSLVFAPWLFPTIITTCGGIGAKVGNMLGNVSEPHRHKSSLTRRVTMNNTAQFAPLVGGVGTPSVTPDLKAESIAPTPSGSSTPQPKPESAVIPTIPSSGTGMEPVVTTRLIASKA